MGTSDGSIIATIIRSHIPRNEAAAPGHVWPGIRIHTIDIVQLPGIGIPPMADMDWHDTIVTAAVATNSPALTPRNAEPCDVCRRSANVVFVMATPPHARLVAPPWRAVEPLVRAPHRIEAA